MDFNEALSNFLAVVGENMKAHYKERLRNLKWSDIPGDQNSYASPPYVAGGRKYLKIAVRGESNHSVYCFIEIATGKIFKADSWKKPSLIDRGLSIYNPESYKNADAYGSWLYLR